MNQVEEADRHVSEVLDRALATLDASKSGSGDADGAYGFSYTIEEEQELEDKLREALDDYRKTVQAFVHSTAEIMDVKEKHEAQQIANEHQQRIPKYVAKLQKFQVSYREHAKKVRLQYARDRLLATDKDSSCRRKEANGNTGDVTASLKRTKQVMSEEIQRVGSVTEVLNDGRTSLQLSHSEYGSANAELAQVRKTIKALQWQARQDRIWIGAGIAILASTILFIVYERSGLIIL